MIIVFEIESTPNISSIPKWFIADLNCVTIIVLLLRRPHSEDACLLHIRIHIHSLITVLLGQSRQNANENERIKAMAKEKRANVRLSVDGRSRERQSHLIPAHVRYQCHQSLVYITASKLYRRNERRGSPGRWWLETGPFLAQSRELMTRARWPRSQIQFGLVGEPYLDHVIVNIIIFRCAQEGQRHEQAILVKERSPSTKQQHYDVVARGSPKTS
jgi:hypothetical protein